jgi:hydrogenase maturation factor
MAHGSGGKASSDLIKDIFVDTFNNDYLATMEDQARFEMPKGRLAFSTTLVSPQTILTPASSAVFCIDLIILSKVAIGSPSSKIKPLINIKTQEQ